MKHALLRKLAIFAVVGATAASLTGCVPFWNIGREVRDGLNEARENIESALDDIDWGDFSDSDGMDFSELDGEFWEEKDNPDDHRENTRFQIDDQTKVTLNLTTNGNRNVIIDRDYAKSWEQTGSLQYDPAHFKVEKKLDGDTLTITVGAIGEAKANPSYKCYVHLPSRSFEKITVNAKYAGFVLKGLHSPMEITAKNSGFTLSYLDAPVKLDADNCGFSMTTGSGFDSTFDLNATNCAFSASFPDGEPDNLAVALDTKDSAFSIPGHWGKNFQNHVEYTTGDGSVKFTLQAKNSAGAISVK